MIILDSYRFGPLGPTDSPANYAGLVRWYKTDTILGLSNNDPITSWPDSSASSDPLVSLGGGTEPLFQTGYYGTLSAAKDGKLALTPFTLPDALTIIMVGNATSDCLLWGHNTLNTQVRIDRAAVDILSFYAAVGSETLSDELPGASTDTRMLSWARDPATSILSFRCNKASVVVAAGGVSFNTLTIGEFGHNPNAPFTSFAGFVGEICVWNAQLSAADIDSLYDNYFKPRFGLP